MSVKYPGSTSELQPRKGLTLWVLQLHYFACESSPIGLAAVAHLVLSINIHHHPTLIRLNKSWPTCTKIRVNHYEFPTQVDFQKCHPKICKSSDMKVKHAESRSCWDLTNKSALNPHLPRRNPAPLQTGYLLKLLHLTSVKRQRWQVSWNVLGL